MLTITFKPSLLHAGTGLVPAHKQCSTYFLKKLGHYLRAGTRPTPAKRQQLEKLELMCFFRKCGRQPVVAPLTVNIVNSWRPPSDGKDLPDAVVDVIVVDVLALVNFHRLHHPYGHGQCNDLIERLEEHLP